MDELLQEYKSYLLCSHSENTTSTYLESLHVWGFNQIPTVKMVTDRLKTMQKTSAQNTVYIRAKALLSFLSYYTDLVSATTLSKMKKILNVPYERVEKRAVTEEEVKEIMKVSSPVVKGIIACIFYGGLRRSEVAKLNIEDWDGEFLNIIKSKRGKSRKVFMVKESRQYIEGYLKIRKDSNERALFLNQLGVRYKCISIYATVKTACSKVGITDISCHNFRHGCGTSLNNKGLGITDIAKHLGHTSINTTQIYINTTDSQLKEKIEKVWDN